MFVCVILVYGADFDQSVRPHRDYVSFEIEPRPPYCDSPRISAFPGMQLMKLWALCIG